MIKLKESESSVQLEAEYSCKVVLWDLIHLALSIAMSICSACWLTLASHNPCTGSSGATSVTAVEEGLTLSSSLSIVFWFPGPYDGTFHSWVSVRSLRYTYLLSSKSGPIRWRQALSESMMTNLMSLLEVFSSSRIIVWNIFHRMLSIRTGQSVEPKNSISVFSFLKPLEQLGTGS